MDSVQAPLLQVAVLIVVINTLGWMTGPLLGQRVSWCWFSSWLFRTSRRFVGSAVAALGRAIAGTKR